MTQVVEAARRALGLARSGLAALRLPEVTIDLGPTPADRELRARFTARHPKFPILQRKRYGVALLPVPDDLAGYLAGGARQAIRTNRKRATDRGFVFRRIDPMTHLDGILAVNLSADSRQGRPMDLPYRTPELVRASFADASEVFGVLDREGVLRAYLDLRVHGDLAILGRLLGHADALADGVMYLLVTETIREVVERRGASGRPSWVMYDTWYGGGTGLRYFKERLGFSPYRVRWR